VRVRPGQLNLMTGGRGVAHSEYSIGEAPLLHALQLWVALPATSAGIEPAFEQHAELPIAERPGLRATVFAGALGGVVSPATVHSPLVGADLAMSAGAAVRLPVRPDFEHAIVVTGGALTVEGATVGPGPLVYLGTGRSSLRLEAAAPAAAVLLGGEPFRDDLVMWWNFVGRDHDEIAAARADWEAGADRFGAVVAHGAERVPAPPLPGVRLRPRRRTH